jgi:uncharacterized protein
MAIPNLPISLDIEAISDFCQKSHIRRLALFGSVLRNDFRPDSDVDMLVEFEEEYVPGLIQISQMEIDLSAIIQKKVDLRTPEELSRYFRDEVVASAQVLYAR